MNKRKTIISSLLTFLVLLVSVGAYKILSNKPKDAAPSTATKEVIRELSVQQLELQSVANYLAIDGRISAYEKLNISANVSGILGPTPKLPKEGRSFKKGELLFDIDQRKTVFNLNALRSSLLNAITLMMPDLKLDYPVAYLNWKEYLDDFEVEKPVKAFPDLSDKEEKNFLAARNIYNLYYNIKSAEVQLSEYKIYAPFSGVITQVNVFPGTMVLPGQLLAAMVNTNRYELKTPISEMDLASVAIGNSVELYGTNPNKRWKGKVVRIGQQIDPTTQMIPIYVSVNGAGLKEGMYLKGQIQGAFLDNVASIPKKLIVNQEYVYVVKDSTIYLEKVEIKGQSKDQVHILPLAPDVWVVFENPRSLFEGQKIIPVFNSD